MSTEPISLEPLTPSEAAQLRQNYARLIQATTPGAAFNRHFRWTEQEQTKFLSGFAIPLMDYYTLVNYVGVDRFYIAFGTNSSEVNYLGDQLNFHLLIQGRNEMGSVLTPWFKLANPISAAERRSWEIKQFEKQSDFQSETIGNIFKNISTETVVESLKTPPYPKVIAALLGVTMTSVPDILSYEWVKEWDKNVQLDTFHKTNLEINTIDGENIAIDQPLVGFSFKRNEFVALIDPMYGIIEKNGDGYRMEFSDYEVHIYMCFHKQFMTLNPTQTNDTAGLMLAGIYKRDNTSYLLSTFHDFSAPCPPTCPR
ncbi:MAG: hypothetical protein ACFB10_09140 [Salibacteraceae bacterium]